MEKVKVNWPLVYAMVGVLTLIAAIAGSAYAYYQATASNSTTVTGSAAYGEKTSGSGINAELIVTKLSTGATGNLIPIDMTTTMLTNAAKGWNTTLNSGAGGIGTSWNASYACKDKYGYTVCQIYSVKIHNYMLEPVRFNLGVTSLTGTNTPNIDVVKMASKISVTNATSIKGTDDALAHGVSVAAQSDSSVYYFMVFVKNLNSAQTDKGAFSGTVSAYSSDLNGSIYAVFVDR